jgi:hypothetical protein
MTRIIDDSEDTTIEINDDLLQAITTMAGSISSKSDVSSKLLKELKNVNSTNSAIVSIIETLVNKIDAKDSSFIQMETYCKTVIDMINKYCMSVNKSTDMLIESINDSKKEVVIVPPKRKFSMIPKYGHDKRIVSINIQEL